MSKDYLSRKAQIILISCLLVPLILFALPFLLFIFWPAISELYPQSVKDRQMKEAVVATAQLAPFPESARDFKISTQGNFMGRVFWGSFTDEPANILEWLSSSSGYPKNSVGNDARVPLECEDSANLGWITTSSGCSRVDFEISIN
jgi:hypothetical protein